MSNETLKTVLTVTAATVPAMSPTGAAASTASVSKDSVQDAGKARFGSGMMRF